MDVVVHYSACTDRVLIFGVSWSFCQVELSPTIWRMLPVSSSLPIMLDCQPSYTHLRIRRCFIRQQLALLLLTGITLAVSACATRPDLDITIHKSERGAVYVERISDRSFQATHPMTLSTDTMARVLRGVIIKDSRGVLGNLASDKPQTIRAFGDEDVEYLAPLLVEGLSRAASDQQIGFRFVKNSAPAQPQSAGTVFCLSDVRFPNVCES